MSSNTHIWSYHDSQPMYPFMSLRETSSLLVKPGPERPSSSEQQSRAAGRVLSGVDRSEAEVRGDRLLEGPGATEDSVRGTELRAEDIALEARDANSTPGEGDVRSLFTSRGTAGASSLRFVPDGTEDAGVASRAMTLILPSADP